MLAAHGRGALTWPSSDRSACSTSTRAARADGPADTVVALVPHCRVRRISLSQALEELQALFVGVSGHSRRTSTALDVGYLRLVPDQAIITRGVARDALDHARFDSPTTRSLSRQSPLIAVRRSIGAFGRHSNCRSRGGVVRRGGSQTAEQISELRPAYFARRELSWSEWGGEETARSRHALMMWRWL